MISSLHTTLSPIGASNFIDSHYGSSIAQALQTLYPDHNWQLWQFKRVPSGFWDEITNQRRLLDSIAKSARVERVEDWYLIKGEEFEKMGGTSLLTHQYHNSLVKALSTVYPEYDWKAEGFTKLNLGFWKDIHNQREFFDGLEREWGIEKKEDWYQIDKATAVQRVNQLGVLLNQFYRGSLIKALHKVYSNYPWRMQKFDKMLPPFWKDKEYQKQFFERFAKERNINRMEDWYNVRAEDIRNRNGGNGILAFYGYDKTMISVICLVEYIPDIMI